MINYLIAAITILTVIILANKFVALRHMLLYTIILYAFATPKIALPFINTSNPRLLLVLILFFISYKSFLVTFKRLLSTIEFRCLLLWVLYLIFSYFVVSGFSNSSTIYELLGILAYYLLLTHYISNSDRKIIYGILYSMLFGYALCMYARLPFILGIDSLPLIIGTIRHQIAGLAGMFSLPILFFLLEHKISRLKRTLIWLWIAVCGVVVFLVSARTAMMGLILISIFYKKSFKRYLLFSVFGVFAFLVITPLEYASFTTERTETLLYMNPEEPYPNEVQFRIKHIEYGLDSFRENPIIGVGYLNWQSIYSERQQVIGDILATHNGYIRILSELGIIGWILLGWVIYINLRGTKFSLTNNFEQNLLYTSLLLIMGVFVCGVGADSFYSRTMYFFLALGMGAKLRLRRENQQYALAQATRSHDVSSDQNPSDLDS